MGFVPREANDLLQLTVDGVHDGHNAKGNHGNDRSHCDLALISRLLANESLLLTQAFALTLDTTTSQLLELQVV
jgi:hypothetical protein